MARMLVPSRPDRSNQGRNKNDYDHECFLCNQPLKVTPKTVWVWVVDGGVTLATPDETEPDVSNVGCHPVGSECAKIIPKEYRFTF